MTSPSRSALTDLVCDKALNDLSSRSALTDLVCDKALNDLSL